MTDCKTVIHRFESDCRLHQVRKVSPIKADLFSVYDVRCGKRRELRLQGIEDCEGKVSRPGCSTMTEIRKVRRLEPGVVRTPGGK